MVEPRRLRLGFADYTRTRLFVLGGVVLVPAGWWLPVPVLNWLLMIAGGFLASVAVFLLVILVLGPREDRPWTGEISDPVLAPQLGIV